MPRVAPREARAGKELVVAEAGPELVTAGQRGGAGDDQDEAKRGRAEHAWISRETSETFPSHAKCPRYRGSWQAPSASARPRRRRTPHLVSRRLKPIRTAPRCLPSM